jgi:hypothetical protein
MSKQAEKSKFTPHTDISLGAFGQFTPTRAPVAVNNPPSGNAITQTTQGTSASAGVLGTFHQTFKPWLGYSVNLGYTRLYEKYSEGSVYIPNVTAPLGDHQTENFVQGSIGTDMYEFSATYSIKGPQNRRFSTFAQLGGGTLAFLPTQDPSPYAVQFRATMVFSAGINFKLSDYLGLRSEYRGLFYKNPDFKNNGPAPTTKLFTVTNEPIVSLVYTLGPGRRKTRMY